MLGDLQTAPALYLALYLAASIALLHGPRLLGMPWRPLEGIPAVLLALVNVVAVERIFFQAQPGGRRALLLYVAVTAVHGLCAATYSRSERGVGPLFWITFLSPVALLVVTKVWHHPLGLLGVSYMCFRLSFIALEMRARPDLEVSLPSHLAYAFFVPTLAIGPISRFASFHDSLRQPALSRHNALHGAMRVFWGYLKFKVLGNWLYLLTFSSLWYDGYRHGLGDFLISSFAYYAYLYANFSGATDIVIGIGALIGVRIDENFNRHYKARNLQEFWTRWHMTLSGYLRDAFFTPVTLWLARRTAPRWHLHNSVAASIATMVMIGVWHGFSAGYLLFGLAQGLGLTVLYYYGALLKRLPKQRRRAYQQSRAARLAGGLITQVFYGLSLFFFENYDLERLRHVVETWG